MYSDDNVGGEHLAAALDIANPWARFSKSDSDLSRFNTNMPSVECGQISEYSTPVEQRYPVRNLAHIVTKRLKIQGFIVNDPGLGPKYFEEHIEKLSAWIADGTFKAREHVTDGIENASQGLLDMLQGKNEGKAVVKIADEVCC